MKEKHKIHTDKHK